MNKKYIIISISALLVITSIGFALILMNRNRNIINNSSSIENIATEQSTNSEVQLDFVDNTYIPEDYSQYEASSVPTNDIKNQLELDKKTSDTDYIYSNINNIVFTYEKESINDKKPIYVRVLDNKVYLSLSEDNLQSGQSIEVINIDPNLRFNTIPEIITQQILIADEKLGCRVEEKNGRYSINPKNSTQTCGNYADINNKFFIKPTEDGSAISKLVFVNAGDQELSYDGSMTGKYWYESVIVE
jgi:hypothetical protein